LLETIDKRVGFLRQKHAANIGGRQPGAASSV